MSHNLPQIGTASAQEDHKSILAVQICGKFLDTQCYYLDQWPNKKKTETESETLVYVDIKLNSSIKYLDISLFWYNCLDNFLTCLFWLGSLGLGVIPH